MSDTRTPLATGLFEELPEPHLIGSRCRECQAFTFPQQDGCPRCSARGMETVPLPRTGTLWTWTSQEFAPKNPPYIGPEGADFTPWLAGYAELEGGLVVEGRLTGFEGREPVIGEPVEVVVVPYFVDQEGVTVTLYAFAPTTGGAGHG